MTARVLVVDDIEFNIKLLDTKLKQDYYQVFTAVNGKEAIAKALEVKPDIILMDIMMPEMDGFEATKIIKFNPVLSFIPIIIVTALNAQEDKVRGLECGADDFLTKPINDHALMTRLKSLVRLKIMDDELRLRDQTSKDLGLIKENSDLSRDDVSGANVLVIDDDKLQYNKISAKLVAKKINTFRKDNIDDIMNNIDTNEYSLIIISTQLLENDGLRFCSALKSHDKYRHMPILILVDESDVETISRGLELGINDYLIAPIDDNELMARCITQIKRKKYQDELKNNYLTSIQQSIRDGLTSLYNRRYLESHVRNILDNSQFAPKTLALLMIDVDHFKNVNDTYGHQSGDAVLVELAKRLNNNLRITDLCARFGGEEFVVLLAFINPEMALNIAERIRLSVESEPFNIPAEPFKIKCTISLGISFLEQADTLDSLIGKADKNLYLAKESGRNKVVA